MPMHKLPHHLHRLASAAIETLPDQLAGLYMKRYEMTFPDDEADSTNPLDQFDSHTRPMLAMLMAARSAVPESALERVKPLPAPPRRSGRSEDAGTSTL